MDDKALLDAVNAGITDAAEPEVKTEAAPEKPADEPVKAGDDKPADGEKPEGDAKPADGEKKEDKPADGAEKPEVKAAADAEKKPDAKPADHVNDPIPEDLKGRTRERMESLISKVKETTEKLTSTETNYNSIMGMIAETKATPEQYGMVLDYLGAVNSDDDTQIRGAISVLTTELKALHEKLGEPLPGTDVLAAHEDLRDAIEVGDMTETHAKELAAARERQAAATRRDTAKTEQQRAVQTQTQALEAGRNALNALEVELKKDPTYALKRDALVATLKPVMARLHPSQWVDAFREAYARMPTPAPAVTPTPTPAPNVQPLRAKSPAGGATKAASSLEEAISMGIDAAARR